MSKIEVTKVCEFCGKKFTAHKMTTRFCSHQCSQRNYDGKMKKPFSRTVSSRPYSASSSGMAA